MDTLVDISIPWLADLDAASPDVLSAHLDEVERHSIAHLPWGASGSTPKTSFAIAHDNENIFLKFYVQEQHLKAVYTGYNDPVYEDSCVEFFIAFEDDSRHYNLEFNCIGTSMMQYGEGRDNRAFIPVDVLKSIRSQAIIKNNPGEDAYWELTLSIPASVFIYHPGLSLCSIQPRVNFYKCGDGLPQPHFMCWSRVEAPEPDFHQSAFFKAVSFGKCPTS